jgi:hypothetical protein
MTQDEIIEIARQAGFVEYEIDDGTTNAFDKRYEAFAKLVEDAAFARWALQTKLAVQDEREACAKACEEEGKMWSKAGCTNTQTFALCATVIRERGKA